MLLSLFHKLFTGLFFGQHQASINNYTHHRGKYHYCSETVADIDINWLKLCQFQGIILDLDNTIISEDDRYLSPHVEAWISEAKSAGFKMFMLSNGKRRHRVIYWSNRLNIPALSPARKPLPKAFKHAISVMQIKPHQVVVIGDSFHTDILGAKIIGCASIQVASLPHPPRWWEKIAGRFVQKSYPHLRELWLFEKQDY
ncbi:YqeG family HAD IIIA-type phosphatase [Calothrix sp. NIES-3974]|uniref:YqeG family HAD IIIA-type phosphatase n=1 Tax=Calothrix sp. NIES-3974 TaxID=2005462 RepID=UPI000B5F16BA|nr:YqeG family HAD IIIA-type phosphatase [Calothrix sp. NIES-3974]BAZ06719.1 HAD-superfamily hydrolase subfamily IIIA [Calothrix sp. NIES-3974]